MGIEPTTDLEIRIVPAANGVTVYLDAPMSQRISAIADKPMVFTDYQTLLNYIIQVFEGEGTSDGE